MSEREDTGCGGCLLAVLIVMALSGAIHFEIRFGVSGVGCARELAPMSVRCPVCLSAVRLVVVHASGKTVIPNHSCSGAGGRSRLPRRRSLVPPLTNRASGPQETTVKNAAMDVVEVVSRITDEAKKNAVSEVRRVKAMAVGQVVRQGDIYVHRVADDHPRGHAIADRQLVPGVTQGSRHVAAGPSKLFAGTKAPEWAPRALVGPVIVSPSKRVRITHPEHAHLDLPAGCYAVTFQRDARTGAAVQD